MTARQVVAGSCVFLLLALPAAQTHPAELEALAITFYGFAEASGTTYLNDKPVEVKPGDRLAFDAHEPLAGFSPDVIEVGVTVRNKGPEGAANVEVRLAASPRVAPLVFLQGLEGSGEDPSTADPEATARGAEWFAPILLARQRVASLRAKQSVEVVFKKIDLRAMLAGYVKRKLWITELRFDASIEPGMGDRTLRDNSVTRHLRIDLPPY